MGSDGRPAAAHPAAALGYTFRDGRWLEQALTHRSVASENPEAAGNHNERLEFLGDAVVDLVVSWWLFREMGAATPEGRLTALRAQMVRRPALAELARRAGLDQRLQVGKGAGLQGVQRQDRALAGAFEAVVGAIFVDGGWEAARAAVEQFLPDLARSLRPAAEANPKGALQELLARLGRASPVYKVLHTHGPPHRRRFTVQLRCAPDLVVTAEGPSRRQAEEAAAREALARLQAGSQGREEIRGADRNIANDQTTLPPGIRRCSTH